MNTLAPSVSRPARPGTLSTSGWWARFFRVPGWPLKSLLCLYPLWWAIGIGQFAFVLFAVPMAWELRRRRPLLTPPGFALWLLFLLFVLLSLVMLPLAAPNTTAGSPGGRTLSIVINLIELASVTILLLYVGNLPVHEVSQSQVVNWLSLLCVFTVAGGVLGMVAPHFGFTSPLEAVLPHGIRANAYAKTFVHPVSAQVQGGVLGHSSPRPAAPWAYTNFWGNNLSILAVWFCIDRYRRPGRRARIWSVTVLVIATVTVVYSLNRGVWFGIILSIGFVVMRLTGRGDVRAVLVVLGLIPIVAISFFLTPLHTVVEARASHGNSNSIRHFLDVAAVKGAEESPILGWGGTRKAVGSAQSIAVGPSASCANCGSTSIGSTGQLWALLFAQGFLGTAFYVGFFLATMWGLRRDRSALGSGTRLITILTVFYLVFYNNLPVAVGLAMIAIALSWRGLVAASRDRAAALATQ